MQQHEYLAIIDDAGIRRGERQHPEVGLSYRNPAARWTGALKGHAFLPAYATNYLIDLDHAIIVDVEATRRDPAGRDAEPGEPMIDRVEERFSLLPEKLAADRGYSTAELLGLDYF